LTIDNSNTRFSGLFRLNSQRLTIDNSVTRLLNLFRINQQGINVNEKNTRFSGLFKVNAHFSQIFPINCFILADFFDFIAE
jgi:hypothetical protein